MANYILKDFSNKHIDMFCVKYVFVYPSSEVGVP